MNGEENQVDQFEFNQPWNPVSYFEEENEATGGNDCGCSYSPGKLASLFETAICENPYQIELPKHSIINQQKPDTLTNNYFVEDGTTGFDVDPKTDPYTVDADSINIISSPSEVNHKAILKDFEMLKRWQESVVDNQQDKDVYISEISPDYSYDFSSDFQNENLALPDESSSRNNSDVNKQGDYEISDKHLNESKEVPYGDVDTNVSTNAYQLHLSDETVGSLESNDIEEENKLSSNTMPLEGYEPHENISYSNTSEQDMIDLNSLLENTSSSQCHIENNENCDIEVSADAVDFITNGILFSDDTIAVDTLIDIADNIVNQNSVAENEDPIEHTLDTQHENNVDVQDGCMTIPNDDTQKENVNYKDDAVNESDSLTVKDVSNEVSNDVPNIDTVECCDSPLTPLVDTALIVDSTPSAVNPEQDIKQDASPHETIAEQKGDSNEITIDSPEQTSPACEQTTLKCLTPDDENENTDLIVSNSSTHFVDQINDTNSVNSDHDVSIASMNEVIENSNLEASNITGNSQSTSSSTDADVVATSENNALADEKIQCANPVDDGRISEDAKPVSFQEDSNTDDNELDQLLDTLEGELDTNTVQNSNENGQELPTNDENKLIDIAAPLNIEQEPENQRLNATSMEVDPNNIQDVQESSSSLETQEQSENIGHSGDADEGLQNPAEDQLSELPPQPIPRSSSVRRVRFSLDNEQEGNDAAPPSEDSALDPSNAAISNEMSQLGWYPPTWIPDTDAKNCMKCNTKFTVVKRRHHCRACGKVLCSQCCNMRFHMPYMDYKPSRVCQTCCDIMLTVLNNQNSASSLQPTVEPPIPQEQIMIPAVLPEAPPPYTEAADGHVEALGSNSIDTPSYAASTASNSRFAEQPASVIPAGQALEISRTLRSFQAFPAGPASDLTNIQLPAYTPSARQRQIRNRSESEMSAVIMFNSTVTNLPPILRRNNEETRIVNNPDLTTLFKEINDDEAEPISFIVNKNLVVRAKVIDMDCCVERRCWCFVSDGMGASNQEEIVILVDPTGSDIADVILTRKILQQMNAIFEKAKHGNPVSELGEIEFDSEMLCMPKIAGLLFFKPSLQCVKKLILPTSPYLIGLYVEESEMPWAKNFPLRLLLRIGAEFKYYPCPLFNVLGRTPVYEGVGRTILELLADFRNFQYTLPRVTGVTINLRGKDTIIRLPQHRYDEVMKAVNASEENVLSLAGNFSTTCDGHLVSVEKDGRYKTQTLSIVLKENRKVTCASFIVISAALKPNQEGIQAKASIVEDGVMVQVTSDVMKAFKKAIKDMKEYSVTAGPASSDESSQVGIEWCTADVVERPRLLSPIDATSFDNLTNMKIRHSYDYTSNSLTAKIHWVEVYFLPQDNDTVQRLSARELGQMTSSIAKACMSALSPHLMALIALDMTRIGLRVNLAADFVEYKIGANLSTLPAELLPTLDDKLVPAIHGVMSSAQERVAVELIFQVVKIV